MPRRPLPVLAALLSVALASPALAGEELTPEKVGAIQYDEEKALGKVDQQHGNKSVVDMSPEERHEVIEEKQAAKREVVEKHGVEMKDYVIRSSKMTTDEQQKVQETKQALKEKDEAEQKAAEQKAAEEKARKEQEEAPHDVVIRRGYGEDEPVDVSDEDEYDTGSDMLVDNPDGDASAPPAEEAATAKPPPAKKAGAAKASHSRKKPR